ncbi:unnamed protein product [Miscanthus lutarioriparius]|uniref:Uncharacterized protein n=1 Tax=Miscanthus lutarioriparius TaxID=422564 RepID=A0A811S3C4_9POAL|nr:unnamed protein product [Miscanthus lutarioriparius]
MRTGEEVAKAVVEGGTSYRSMQQSEGLPPMVRAEANWERLVCAALRGKRLVGAYGQLVTGIAGNVPSSLGNNVHIEEVLRAADEI